MAKKTRKQTLREEYVRWSREADVRTRRLRELAERGLAELEAKRAQERREAS